MTVVGSPVKVCTKCKAEVPPTRKLGWCNDCARAQQKVYRDRWREERDRAIANGEEFVCNQCFVTKAASLFSWTHPRRCNDCRSVDNRFRKYGVTREVIEDLYEMQDNRCDICETYYDNYSKLHIDHDHANGFVRGLLCFTCNSAIGLAQENPDICEAMADYLRFWSSGQG